MTDTAQETKGKRRPTEDDVEPLLELMWDGLSLSAACRKIGLHIPSTSDFLTSPENKLRSEQYARAREGRGEALQERALTYSEAAARGDEVDGKKLDPAGVRVYAEQTRWMIARMTPKVQKLNINHTFGALDDDALDAEIKRAEREAAGLGEGEA